MTKALEIAYELRRIYWDDIYTTQAAEYLQSQDAEINRLRELNAELIKALEANSSALHCFTDFSIYSLPDDKIAYEQIAENEITLAKAKEQV